MKVIDLLKDLCDGKQVPKKIKYGGKEYVYDIEHNDYVTTKRPHDVISLSLTWSYQYSDEIEIIEEEKIETPTLDDIKNIGEKVGKAYRELFEGFNKGWNTKEEKPKKIEEIPFNNGMESFMDVYHELENYNYRINDLIRAVNYLLEKESDK